jgi:hypothetical protein
MIRCSLVIRYGIATILYSAAANLVLNPEFADVDIKSNTGAASWSQRTGLKLYERTMLPDGKPAMKWNSSDGPAGTYSVCQTRIAASNIVPGNRYVFSADIRTENADGVSG